MAAIIPKKAKEKKVTDIISFAEELLTGLSSKLSEKLAADLEKNVFHFPNNLAAAAGAHYEVLDTVATSLWNLSIKLTRDDSEAVRPATPKKLNPIVLARVFAFLILDCVRTCVKGDHSNMIRLMKICLKTAKVCIDSKYLDLALKLLEKFAAYEERLAQKKDKSSPTPDEQETYEKLNVEYFLYRTALAWRQDRLDIAEHLQCKPQCAPQASWDPAMAENFSDLLFDIGRELLDKDQHEMAVKWLDRAYSILATQDLDRLSFEAGELRTSIIQSLVTAHLSLLTEDSFEKAAGLVNLLEHEVGDKLIVLLLRLELLSSPMNDVFDGSDYGAILRRMIKTVVFTDSNLKLILHRIHILHVKNPSIACTVLDELLLSRVLPEANMVWTEKVLIARLSMSIAQRDSLEMLDSLNSVLDQAARAVAKPVGPDVTSLAQTLLWKQIEANYVQNKYELSEKWCHLALHKVFGNMGHLNQAKISRKLLLCAISRQDIGQAREIFGGMDQAAQDEPMTRFLMHKIAIRCDEVELASQCLDKIAASPNTDPSLLYGCVIDAQQLGSKPQAIAAMEKVLEKYEHHAPDDLHITALLRCSIRLITAQLDAGGDQDAEQTQTGLIGQLCRLYEGALRQARADQSKKKGNIFKPTELEWFSKTAYNLALKHCRDWPPHQVLTIIESSLGFIELSPKDISEPMLADLTLRSMFCNFLAAALLIVVARGEDDIARQLQAYLRVRGHVASYDKNMINQVEKLEEDQKQDLVRKLTTLLAYEFEAAVRLKAWDDLDEIVIKAEMCASMKIYEIFGDCILSCEAPTNVVITTLKKIVNEAWGLESFDAVRLARYSRVLFQYALPSEEAVAAGLLDQIQALAKEASETQQPYPAEELEWIVTTSFNHAIDLYCAGNDQACREWAAKSMNIASLVPDDGVLHRELEHKFMALNWDA